MWAHCNEQIEAWIPGCQLIEDKDTCEADITIEYYDPFGVPYYWNSDPSNL